MTRLLITCLCFAYLAIGCASPTNAKNTVQKLYQSVNPGVVELHVKALAGPKPGQVNYQATTQGSLGSGALISKEGRILTAAHVVDRATEIEVIFNDGSKTSGHVVWVDSLIDIAMIQAAEVPKSAKVLPLAESKSYLVGDQVIVIGAPYGVSHSLSVGYLSGIRDKSKIPATNIVPRYIQSDASINQGNSGGPMLNTQGEIIGIVSHILSSSGGSNGLGFAVSIDTINQVLETEPMTFSGLIPVLLNEQLSNAINNPYGYGLLVQQVIPGTLADKLNFQGGHVNALFGTTPILLGGDIIVSIAGYPMKDIDSVLSLRERFSNYETGEAIVFKYLRNGLEQEVIWTIE